MCTLQKNVNSGWRHSGKRLLGCQLRAGPTIRGHIGTACYPCSPQAASLLLEALEMDASLAGDAFVELYSGEGGTDAMDWCLKLKAVAL